jgi:hypothetical protein
VSLVTAESYELQNNGKRGGGFGGDRQVNWKGDEFEVGRDHSFMSIKIYVTPSSRLKADLMLFMKCYVDNFVDR